MSHPYGRCLKFDLKFTQEAGIILNPYSHTENSLNITVLRPLDIVFSQSWLIGLMTKH
jgi:hypothetical protein